VHSVRKQIAAQAEDARRVDARALPMIGFGIVLSGIPEFLAESRTLGEALFIGSLATLMWAVSTFWSRSA